MSLQYTGAVWNRSAALDPQARLFLLAVASLADQDGIAWGNPEDYGRRACLDPDSLPGMLKRLHDGRELFWVKFAGRHYWVVMIGRTADDLRRLLVERLGVAPVIADKEAQLWRRD